MPFSEVKKVRLFGGVLGIEELEVGL